MNHGKILSQAWEITWNNRVLWGLGFLAALSSGGGGGGGGSFNTSSFDGEQLPEWARSGPIADAINGDTAAIAAFAGAIAIGVILLLIISFVLWIVSQAARVGLIKSVINHQNGEKLAFGSAFSDGFQYVLRILGFKIVLFVIPIMIFAASAGIIGAVVGSTISGGLAAGLIALLTCGFVIVLFPLMFTDAYGYRSLVLKNMGIVESIGDGWRLFRANLGDSLILGIMYGVISMVFGFIVAAVLGVFAVVSFFSVGDVLTTGTLPIGALVGGLAFILITAVVSALLMSVFTAWQSTGFTLAYQHITGTAVDADIPSKEKGPDDVNFDSMI